MRTMLNKIQAKPSNYNFYYTYVRIFNEKYILTRTSAFYQFSKTNMPMVRINIFLKTLSYFIDRIQLEHILI